MSGSIDKWTRNDIIDDVICGGAGIGRQARLRCVCICVWVQVPSAAPAGMPPRAIPTRPPHSRGPLLLYQVLVSAWSPGHLKCLKQTNKKGPVSGPFLFGAARRDRQGLSARSTRKRGPSGPPFHTFPPLRQKRLPLTGTAKHLKCQKTTNQCNTNLFPIEDRFGLLVFFERFKETSFRNKVYKAKKLRTHRF